MPKYFVVHSPTKSSGKLEMLAGVKSQMSGWLSGGIPGLNRGSTAPDIVDNSLPAEPIENQKSRDHLVQGVFPDHVKDDDASRWVAGYVRSGLRATAHI